MAPAAAGGAVKLTQDPGVGTRTQAWSWEE